MTGGQLKLRTLIGIAVAYTAAGTWEPVKVDVRSIILYVLDQLWRRSRSLVGSK